MLWSALVIEDGDALARTLYGLNWAIGQGVHIVSMSLGWPGYDPALLPIFEVIRRRGILPVIAIGNEGANTSRSPGNYQLSMSVGASDQNSQVAEFSSSQARTRPRHSTPTLVAPGVDINSCLPGGRYGLYSGTSMAAPQVAGLAALLMSARPHASVAEVEAAILASCQLPAGVTADRGGAGIPSAVRALNLLP